VGITCCPLSNSFEAVMHSYCQLANMTDNRTDRRCFIPPHSTVVYVELYHILALKESVICPRCVESMLAGSDIISTYRLRTTSTFVSHRLKSFTSESKRYIALTAFCRHFSRSAKLQCRHRIMPCLRKKTIHLIFDHIFGKCKLNFKICSLLTR